MADTNIYYGSGIGVAGNIDIGGIGLSADSRLMVKTRAGLDELKAAKRVYDGMIVYCEADQTYHKCRVVWDDAFNIVSCSWTEVVIKSEKELESFIANKTTAAMEFKGATATLPENPARGDMYKVAGENINIIIDGISAKIGDSVVYNGTQWFLIPSGDDIESNTTYEFEGQKKSSEVSFKVKPSDNIEETIYLDSYSQKEVDTKLDNYVTSKSIKETLNWITNVQSGDTSVELANKASYADEASYAESAGSANTAGSAGTATKATQDINGNNIVDTYATKSEVAAKQDKLESGVNIKTINGQSLLDSGDLVLNADGSISTNPDWNQNDETKIDYIKNRTHYKYKGKDVIIAENVLLTAVGDCQFESASHPVDEALLYEGAQVVLTFADNTYGSTLYYDSVTNEYYCNEGIWIGESDVVYTLTLASNYIRFECFYFGFYGETELPISIKIKNDETVYVPLDEKYIPDSIARKTEIAELTEGKVDKIVGKGLSTNDYTTTEKNKLAGIAAGAEKNVQADWSQADSTKDDFIKNKTHYKTIGSTVISSIVGTNDDWYGEVNDNNIYADIDFRTAYDDDLCPKSITLARVGLDQALLNSDISSFNIESFGNSGNINRQVSNSYTLIYLSDDIDTEMRTEHTIKGDIAILASKECNITINFYIYNPASQQEGMVNIHIPSAGLWITHSTEMNNVNFGTYEYHTLDEHYIPDTIARKEEVANTYALNTRYEGTGENSFIANDTCQASSKYCFACGNGSQATALGAYAEGRDTLAKSFYSHAEGFGTITNNTCQHVQGHFNKIDGSALHIVGNGKNEEERSNAHVLYNNGDAWYAGEVAAASIKIGNTVFTEEQLTKILAFIDTISMGGN